MVVTSSSSTPLQKSMPWPRQKALVHSEQDVDLDREAISRAAWDLCSPGRGGRTPGLKMFARWRRDGVSVSD